MSPRRESLVTVALFVVCSLAVIVPICLEDFQIGVDTPTHLSILRVMRLAFEDPSAFHRDYAVRMLQPYWGYYAPTLLLSVVLPLDLSAKLITGLTLIGIPIATALIAKREGLKPIVALPAFALCYNFNFWFGFLPFLSGLVALLFGLLSVLRYQDSPGWRNLGLLGLVSLGVFASHVIAWLLFGACSAWLLFVRAPRSPLRAAVIGLFALVPAALLLLAWSRGVERTAASNFIVNNPLSHDVAIKAWNLPHNAFSSIDPTTEFLLLGLWLGLLTLAMAGPVDAARKERCFTWGGLAMAMFAGYWVVPQDLAGVAFLYERLIMFALLFPLLCVAKRRPFERLMPALSLAMVALTLSLSALMFRQFNGEMSGAKTCLATARPRSNLMGLMLESGFSSWGQPLMLHADSYHLYWNLGRVFGHAMDAAPNSLVYYRQQDVFHALVPTLEWQPLSYRPAYGKNIDYFLIHGPARHDIALLKDTLQGLDLACEQGQWRLYSSSM